MDATLQLDEPVPVQLTVDDFMLLEQSGAFDGYARTELIEGTIVAMNAQWVLHARAKSELAFNFKLALRDLGLDLDVIVEGSVRLGERNLPVPDVSVCDPLVRARIPVPAASLRLAVEISDSTLNYDLGVKSKLYARAGVREYWVVDLTGNELHRMIAPSGDRYTSSDVVALGGVIASLTIPGLDVSTDGLT